MQKYGTGTAVLAVSRSPKESVSEHRTPLEARSTRRTLAIVRYINNIRIYICANMTNRYGRTHFDFPDWLRGQHKLLSFKP